jgi:hypothetical protein
MKVHDIPKSGKRGKIVAFKSRFGQCEREHTPATKRPTDKQQQSASAFGAASLGWNGLTDEQLDAWRAYGKKVRSHPRGGQSGPLTGQNLFTAINRNQALLAPPHEGQCDITAQYLKVFGSPWPNSRIILHLVQQVDGWRDLPHQVEAVFRPIPPVSPPSPRRQAPVAAR